VRKVVAIIVQMFSQVPAGGGRPQEASPAARSGGELKKDPVCGTFVAVTSSIKGNVDGEVIHFCSTACRDKYLAA
jgi:YHS domain-containing protein